MVQTKRVSVASDPIRDRVHRAERIVRATPEDARRAATSRPAIDALGVARDTAKSKGHSVWSRLEVLVEFLDTLARLDAPHLDDAVLLQRFERDRDHRTPTEVLQSCRGRVDHDGRLRDVAQTHRPAGD